MRKWIRVTAVVIQLATPILGEAQAPIPPSGNATLPAPGSRGNGDNVPYIGRRDPNGNPVRLARATGHVSKYSEEKVPPYARSKANREEYGRAVAPYHRSTSPVSERTRR
jgi:hypothetical protein